MGDRTWPGADRTGDTEQTWQNGQESLPVNCFEYLIHSDLFRNRNSVNGTGHIGQESVSGRDILELPTFYKHFNLSALIQLPVMTSLSLQSLKPKLGFFLLLLVLFCFLFFSFLITVPSVRLGLSYPSSTGCARWRWRFSELMRWFIREDRTCVSLCNGVTV